LAKPPSRQPANSLRLARNLKEQFAENSGAGYRAVGAFSTQLRDTLTAAAANARVAPASAIRAYALRLTAPLFGHNVPKRTQIEENGTITILGDWPVIEVLPGVNGSGPRVEHEQENAVFLDAKYDQITPGSWVVIETQNTRLTVSATIVLQAKELDASRTRSEYGMTAATTRIDLGAKRWIRLDGMDPSSVEFDDFDAIRTTTVFAQPEELEIAEEPIGDPICGGSSDSIELDGYYEDLESGRWVIVSGEREIEGTSGVRFSELAMLSSVTQDVAVEQADSNSGSARIVKPGERIHTFIRLSEELAYCFRRTSVTIFGNVVNATHGETRREVLGSGDGSQSLQSFDLKQKPLTQTSASNPSGVESTLQVFVNDVRWHESETLATRHATDRNYVTKTSDDEKTSIVFGNGEKGARLPTGSGNVRAKYRTGLGRAGNVKAGQISLLQTKPLGVKAVINPLRASGGADKESRDQARMNVPLAIKALDRLVSVRDYQDFSRSYAGVGKAHATELSDRRRHIVHVTVAGADDIPIDINSDLYRNLRSALQEFGDPRQVVQLAIRELLLVVVSARVRILPDYEWESVATGIRAAMLYAFGFEQRELGEDVLLSKVISVMHAVRGVGYVDLDILAGIPEKKVDAGIRRLLTPDEITLEVQEAIDLSAVTGRPAARLRVNLAKDEGGIIRPAQLAILAPDLAETLILNQIE
jgi:hypothetical protein